MSVREEIIASLEPLFSEACQKGYWFYSAYQSLWFSPTELRVYQANGKFIWGPSSWKLRDPNERLRELNYKKHEIEEQIRSLKIRMD